MKVTNKKTKYKNRSDADNKGNWDYLDTFYFSAVLHYAYIICRIEDSRKVKKCDVRNYGWEGRTWKT